MPARGERRFCQSSASGEAVQHAAYSFPSRFLDHCPCVVFRVASVHHDGQVEAACEIQLRREGASLQIARRIVVVVVQPALAHGNGTTGEQLGERVYITRWVEVARVVRVHARRVGDKARIRLDDPGCLTSLLDRSADADDSRRAGVAGAGDYLVAVTGEGLVREVGVAVDEACFHAALTRGYLRSIQRSTGPAT